MMTFRYQIIQQSGKIPRNMKQIGFFILLFTWNQICKAGCTGSAGTITLSIVNDLMTPSSVSLSWDHDGASLGDWGSWLYTVQYRTSSQGGSYIDAVTFDEKDYSIANLTPGVAYDFRIKGMRTCEIDVNNKQTIFAMTSGFLLRPAIPSINSATNIQKTSFTANWQTTGAVARYFLDVSKNSNLSSPVYNDQRVDIGTSFNFANLSPGTTYYYRVRGANASGTSPNSTVKSVITLPDAPPAQEASGITTSSFTANWESVMGAASYRLDVSTSLDFSVLLPGYSNLAVSTGTSKEVSGSGLLSPGTVYYYRVRAVNANGGLSANSGETSVVTVPAAPVLSDPSGISTTAFTANWQNTGVVSASFVDLSEHDDFSALIYDNQNAGNSELFAFENLAPGTTYYYRIRASNASGPSLSSMTASVITLPDAPPAQEASSITTSSFTASWASVMGADSYRLDVSGSSDFSDLLAGFSDLTVSTGTSEEVSGEGLLSPGTVYYYRVRAVNANGGVSANSGETSVVTVPAAPVLSDPSEISTIAFTANWQNAGVVSTYFVDLSLEEDFSTLVFDNQDVGNVASYIFESLTPGTTYYYRVRASNASGESVSSSTGTAKTVSVAPTAPVASDITINSFTISWAEVTGAESYRIDVSTNSNFQGFLEGYDNRIESSGNTLNIGENILAGTRYYVRVRAYNSGGISANSAVLTVLTLPASPLGFETSDNQPTAIKISWQAVKSAAEYQLLVSTTESFTTVLDDYNPKVIAGGATTTYVVEGLAPSTTYHFRLFAKNSTGLSDYVSQTARTLPSDGILRKIEFNSVQYAPVHYPEQPMEISISLGGGSGQLYLDFHHRKNGEQDFTVESISSATNEFKVEIDDSFFDEFGMEFYFSARDEARQVETKMDNGQPFGIVTGLQAVTIPVTDFGTEIKNYHIISFPYVLSKSQIETLMVEAMGKEYDKKQWRFVQYDNGKGKYLDFSEGLGKRDIVQGQGYWFISKEAVTLGFGEGKGYGNSLDAPFRMQLRKGWNQIGNPFPYDLSWSAVLADPDNEGAEVEQELLTLDKENGDFKGSDLLPVFGGGFVFAENDTEVIFSVTVKSPDQPQGDGGRVIQNLTLDEDSGANWFLPLTLTQGKLVNSSGGIGMRSGAREGKDKYDRVTPPRFFNYAEINSRRAGFDFDLSTDIVSPSDSHQWKFSVESNSTEAIALKWNREAVGRLSGQLVLYDNKTKMLVSMAETDVFSTLGGTDISIFFQRGAVTEFTSLELGKPFPNPFQDQLTIPFFFSPTEKAEGQLTVFDLNGRELFQRTIYPSDSQASLVEMSWDGTTSSGDRVKPGLYFFQLQVVKGRETEYFEGRIIKQ
jgi:phosphodiesterase/alkaline phosphatase D-like protein